ncbi:MAG: methyltransferase domain-containing protein [Deltaproteobacteria bacterium]|jgi:SAM-dependent methyltransferase|nr:methyltransferase domain-containing protein [Deltaproteobacteria bacterium]MBW2533650.1 methyltransferase domain-containing protein [Deltaproteobacteria bacterium]
MDTPDRNAFDEIYRRLGPEQIAWHYDEPPEQLIELLDSGQVRPCKALELGCGLGTQSLALAQRGFDVTGVDCSRAAIDEARRRAARAGARVRYLVADLLTSLDELSPPYEFAWDWEVLHHVFPAQRPALVRSLSGLLGPGGRYLSVAFSEKDPWLADQGKYRKTPIDTVLYFSSQQELRELFEPSFEVLALETIEIRGKREPHLANWLLVQKRR